MKKVMLVLGAASGPNLLFELLVRREEFRGLKSQVPARVGLPMQALGLDCIVQIFPEEKAS